MYALFQILVLFTPLVFSSYTSEMFEFPKMYVVYILGSTLFLIAYLNKYLNNKPFIIKKDAVFIFTVIYFIASVLSVHLYTSFWGYYSRFNGGFFSYFIYYLIYLSVLNFDFKILIKDIYKPLFLSSMPLSCYGIMQYFKHTSTLLQLTPIERVYSTFGQPNWLAAYLTMVMPLIIYAALKNNNQLQKVLLFALYILNFVCLWLTFSISGLLAYAVTSIMIVIFYWELIKNNFKYLTITFLIILAIVAPLSQKYLFKVLDIKNDVNKIIKQSLIAKVYADNNLVSDPGYIRLVLWQSTLDLITSHPKIFIIGTGPGTFPYTYQKFRAPELNYSSEWNYIFNKPHNYYLEIWSETGILGLISYLILLTQTLKSKKTILICCFSSLYITNIFGWPTVATNLLFYILLAINKNYE